MQQPFDRKRARFALEKDYTVHEVPHRGDYPREEIWYQRQEYDKFRDEIKRIVALIERRTRYGRPKLAPSIQECTRGLECQTQEGAVAKRVACLDSICAVLMEQDHQQSVGKFSDEAIRRRYIEMNCIHVEAALKQGQKDADYENETEIVQGSNNTSGNKKAAGRTMVNSRRNRNRISRLLFGVPQRSNSFEKR